MKAREILIYFSIKYNGDWENIYNAIKNKEEIKESEEELTLMINNVKSKMITILDDNYPDTLKNMYRPPFVLYYHGDISLLDCKNKSIAVVGSRACSSYGIENTHELVKELCKELVIVSGMAKGIDAVSHAVALENNGRTIAVLGSGINYIYPYENEDLYNQIIKKNLIISEYPDKIVPTAKSFPTRNRIVAGLTNCVLIPEAKRKSGSSITANLVLHQGGSVCVCPERRGKNSLCNYLIQNGARLVETVNDVYDEMNYCPHESIFK